MKSFGRPLTLALMLVVSATAQAQPVPQGATATKEADDHFLKGKAFMKDGNLRGAYEEYKAAWGLKRTYDIAANLGNVEMTLRMPRDAAEHLAFALRSYAVTGVTPDKIERMRQVFAQARAQVGAVQIKVSVDDAEVSIDGRPLGRAPIAEEVFVEPGAHVIEGQLTGYGAARVTITAEKGGAQTATLALSRSPVGPNKTVLITGGTLAGIGVVMGAVFAGVSTSKAKSAANQRAALMQAGTPVNCGVGAQATPACAALADAANAQRSFANASVWTFVGGGLAGAATLVYALASPRSAAPARVGLRVLPAAGPQGGGLVVRGSW
jgi:hypothetical protein